MEGGLWGQLPLPGLGILMGSLHLGRAPVGVLPCIVSTTVQAFSQPAEGAQGQSTLGHVSLFSLCNNPASLFNSV